jgi:histidine ammonia-lyase
MLMLDGQPIGLDALRRIAYLGEPVLLSPGARERMAASRAAVDRILDEGLIVYGVNTGFGKLSDVHVPPSDLRQLQLNLVRSHSCGVGQPLSIPEVRAMMALRANVLALGFSGARPETAEMLARMLEAGVHPVVPEKGSVGASGDLAPLAHLALAMIGEGDAIHDGSQMASSEALRRAGIAPLELQAKEGLALLNGTQAMGAVGGLAIWRAIQALRAANVAGAMSLEALLGTPTAFDERIHDARPHAGQAEVAGHLRGLLAESEIRESHRVGDPRVQDAYSLRCMPQVHGAVLDALRHARSVFELESAGATDNPLVFVDGEQHEFLSGGNFHGAPLAYAMDYAAIALADLASIVERRIDRLVNPDLNEGLPAFLAGHPGCSSGLMIAHVTAASLLAECRVLAHPSSCDNTPTSGGKEDHVSMGMTGALKLRQAVENVETMLAIELICAAQGLEYRKPLRPGKGVASAVEQVRSIVPPLGEDRSTSEDIARLHKALADGLLS